MNDFSFLGFEFSPLKPEEGKALYDFLLQHTQPLAGYTFATLAAWQPFFKYSLTFAEPETLLISCIIDSSPYPHLLQPVGSLSAQLAEKLLKEATDLAYPLKILGACKSFLEGNPDFVKWFSVSEDPTQSNYLYKSDSLAKLPGRKYSKKRNLLAQAASIYTLTAQTLTADLVDSCFTIIDAIAEEERPHIKGMLQRELAALDYTLHHFDKLGQQGLLIAADGKPAAFSVFEPINPSTAAIHFERALRSYKGLYQVINCETAKVIEAKGFAFINREEDLGDPGLRDAKLSYHPIEIVPSYELTFKK